MKKIILDTNFLLIPGQFKVDIISEIDRIMDDKYKLYAVDKTFDELNEIIKESPRKYKESARIGKLIIRKHKVAAIKTKGGHADDLILNEARKNPKNTIVATQDKFLKARLKKRRVKVIILRQRRYLVLI